VFYYLCQYVSMDLIGQSFGRLTVVAFSHFKARATSGGHRRVFWHARCSCDGNVKAYNQDALRSGKTRSCGCLVTDFSGRYVHGLSSHPLYDTWYAMMDRCYNEKNDSYRRYGGRGIRVCEQWHDLAVFLQDMTSSCPGENYTMDRVNNDGNYEPNNVRWATS